MPQAEIKHNLHLYNTVQVYWLTVLTNDHSNIKNLAIPYWLHRTWVYMHLTVSSVNMATL
uniref:Uncharacterized protein n=1 Tax=Anguilla anguilla TaxID=7936 RepID=A0A0E9RI03_ANGAN